MNYGAIIYELGKLTVELQNIHPAGKDSTLAQRRASQIIRKLVRDMAAE